MWILLFVKWFRGARTLARASRLVAYVAVLLVVAGFFTVRAARAEVLESSLQLGRDLLPLSDLLGERHRLDLDGETVWVGNAVSSEPMGTILDRFAAHCREGGVGATDWEGAHADASKFDPQTFDLGIVRHQKENEGVVLCFPQAEGTAKSWTDRLVEFEKTQDIGSMGKVRYAFVRTDGASAHVLTLWTGDHFRLNKLVATDAFEPGSDHPDLPRPIRSRRTISASLEGTPYGVRGYLSVAAPREVVNAYDAEMEKRGFQVVQHGLEPERDVRGYMKEDKMIVLGASPSADGLTIVSLAEMGTDRRVNPAEQNVVRVVER